MLGEDVENQRGAVDDLDLDGFLQRIELRGAQLTVADHGVGTGGQHHLTQLLRLTRADIGRRIGLVAALDEAFEHLRTGGLRERGEFGHACIDVRGAALGPHAHQHDAFQPKLAVLDLRDVGEFSRQSRHPA